MPATVAVERRSRPRPIHPQARPTAPAASARPMMAGTLTLKAARVAKEAAEPAPPPAPVQVELPAPALPPCGTRRERGASTAVRAAKKPKQSKKPAGKPDEGKPIKPEQVKRGMRKWLRAEEPCGRFFAVVHARWPELFPANTRVPLAEDIHEQLAAALGEELDQETLALGVKTWTTDRPYLNFLKGSVSKARHGLGGPQSMVTEADALAAAEEIARRHRAAHAEAMTSKAAKAARLRPVTAWENPDHPLGQFHAAVHARWPRLFPASTRRVPLAVGIHKAMLPALDGVLHKEALDYGMRAWTKGPAYLRAIAASEGKPRYGISGPEGTVTPGDALGAAVLLEFRAQRRAAEQTAEQIAAVSTEAEKEAA